MTTQIKAHSIWRNRKTQGFYQVMVPDAIDCTNGRSLPVTAMVVYREAGNLVPLSGDQVFVRVRDEFLEKFEPCPPCIEFGRVGQGVLMTKLPMLTQQFSAADRTLLTQYAVWEIQQEHMERLYNFGQLVLVDFNEEVPTAKLMSGVKRYLHAGREAFVRERFAGEAWAKLVKQILYVAVPVDNMEKLFPEWGLKNYSTILQHLESMEEHAWPSHE